MQRHAALGRQSVSGWRRECIAPRGAVITGAGIGQAIAETFALAGAAVLVSHRALEAAQAVATQIFERGGRALAATCDVTREEHLAIAIGTVVRQCGQPTILARNTGGSGPKLFNMPMANFQRAFELNVFSLFRLTRREALRPGHERIRQPGVQVIGALRRAC